MTTELAEVTNTLFERNHTRRADAETNCIHQLFETQVAR